MPRIRSIKPEFWTSEQIVECSPNARLLFIGLWNFCDDGGVHPASTARAKMQIFPADPFTKSDVQAMIDELIDVGLLVHYEVEGRGYWRVSGWKHQRIDQPTYRHPLPSGEVPDQPNRRRTVVERSPSVRRTPDECSPPEKERRGKGEDRKDARAGALRKPDFLENQVWNDFRSYRTSKKAKLTSTAWTRILAELERGIARGHDPNDMLGEAMEAGWTGFKVEWFENRVGKTATGEREGPLGQVLE